VVEHLVDLEGCFARLRAARFGGVARGRTQQPAAQLGAAEVAARQQRDGRSQQW
jgi:hypothetical protein